MHLIDMQRTVGAAAPFLPCAVAPCIAADVKDLAVGIGPCGGVEGIGIGLPAHLAVGAGHHIFVAVVDLYACHGQLPYTAVHALHGRALPAVKVACQPYFSGMRRP